MLLLSAFQHSGYTTYAFALLALWAAFGACAKWRERTVAERLRQADVDGASDPVSLHPVINPETCVGCGACTHACPEGSIIGMLNGKAHLLDGGACIGHGACQAACPVGAIDLVFGSARRGVDIPIVDREFCSTIPGIYIAGELGGMGLIANAIEQGRQAIDTIAARADLGQAGLHDVIIVGAGPAGISASLAAKQKGLRYLTLEQDTLGGTVAHFPRGKIIMTRPAELPLYGQVRFTRVAKERLLELWQSVIATIPLNIRERVRVEHIRITDSGFELETSAGPAKTKTILLATGRRGSPKKLGIAGEELAKVVYKLDDPGQYDGQHVLMVGGGEAALEAAVALSHRPIASLTLAHRGKAFTRPKPAIRARFEQVVANGRANVLMDARLVRIEDDRVTIDIAGETHVIRNDWVIVCAGGVVPMALLNDIGVRVERKYGTA